MGYIKRLGWGIYHWGQTKAFEPDINKTEIRINRMLSSALPYTKYCIWNTSILNKWMLHQPSEFYTIVEIEKEALESGFYILREQYANISLQPGKEILNRYVLDKTHTVIVMPLISEAPIKKGLLKNTKRSIFSVTIEKLIVDLFSEKEIFSAQQGSELPFIINNLLSLYSINFNKMFRYAARRSKKEPLLELLNSKTKFPDFYFK